ncbi:Heparinase II/III-like protein [Mariniphaga anaerophila]|uniref:Heparinase II/III-like protein n=1 Tax=Mariniphaga anaerophila TaxID=1484053 RepID=A0A1M4ZRK0_9BACT|nr:DUF4962 domain-containing protein [Mariniphaga anaerophila]SHF20628.1 Heparinase II/III-like protein [Mariniphaga anaerophila]
MKLKQILQALSQADFCFVLRSLPIQRRIQNTFRGIVIFLLLMSLFNIHELCAQELDRQPLADEVNYSPRDEEVLASNPPAFIWLPLEGVDSYILQYSQSPGFESAKTTTIRDLTMTVHIPTETINSGKWYWRYGYSNNSGEKFGRTRLFEIPENAVAFPFIPVDEVIAQIPKERPRLHFTPELVDDIRNDKEGRFTAITEATVTEAEAILEMDEPLWAEPEPWAKSENPRYAYVNEWRTMRPYTQRMVTSALAYIYTGEERFAMEAKRRLLHFMEWDVEGPSTSVGPDELGMDIIENCSPVFDWVYPVLTKEEKEKCTEVLTARLHQISYKVHRARPMETRPFASHQGRMIGFVVEGSIALAHEAPEVSDWLNYTLKLLWSMYPAWGYTEGGWSEGIHYWRGYMDKIFRVVAQLDKFGIPLKDKPFFSNTGYYGFYAAFPNRPTQSFGDLHELPVNENVGRMLYKLGSLYSNPYFLWHAGATGAGHPTGRDAFLYDQPKVEAKVPSDIPQSRVFNDIGLVVMHSNMAEPENNVSVLFQSNPFGALSHNFACQNAFVIEGYGEPLAMSTGSRQLYGCPHHSEWMWHTKAHNSILVDNEGQVIRNSASKGKIINYEDNGDFVYTAGDATQAYGDRLERFHRHMLYIRPDYVVIVDDLKTSGEKSTFQWLLHGPTEIQVDKENLVMVNRSGNVSLATRFLAPQQVDFIQHSGFTPQLEDSTKWRNQFHLTASTTNPEKSMRFVTVMKVDQFSGEPVKMPDFPTTPRHQLEIKNIDNLASVDESVLQAEMIDAEGGLALRLGNNLILWKESGASQVKAAGVTSGKNMEFKKDFFQAD